MNEVTFEKAKENEIKDILLILNDRCTWLEKNNIKQWNKDYYLKKYNYDYFLGQINSENDLYIAKINNIVIGVFLLKYKDIDYWNDTEDAIYIHHLATKINRQGLGKIILKYIEEIALEKKLKYIRLDCVSDNLKLNKYYQENGFKLKKNGIDYNYYYNLYEKCIVK